MSFHRIFPLLATLIISSAAMAHDYSIGKLHIGHPVARPTNPAQTSSAAYFSIDNKGEKTDRLIAISTTIAKAAQIHTMSMEGDIMRMREVGNIELKPASSIVMQPGHGYHIMLMGLKRPLKTGDKFPLTLTFEKAGKLEVSVQVEEVKQGMKHPAHEGK